jgi:transcriptional regulator GlxA family with amidase domain
MKHLTVVVPDGQTVLDSIVAPYMLLKRADQYWQQIGNEQKFKVELAGITKEVSLYKGLFTVHPQSNLNEITKTDLIIIPAIQPIADFPGFIKRNEKITAWILEQYKSGAEVVSLCTGAFLLASTGLLAGKSCSTHWGAENLFRQMFPKVNLVTDKIITDEHGIYTSGGAFSFLNFLLYLVEKYYDRQTAIYCSKIFEIDIDRNSQSPFVIFGTQKNHDDETIKKAQSFLENNFRKKISMENLASSYAVGRRNFDRRFKKATGNTPLEYLQRIKIEAAKKNFESTRKSIKEVMFEVGYSDLKAFRTIFRKITGLSPVQYRNKYNREAAVNTAQ